MSRSIWKGNYLGCFLYKNLEPKKNLQVWSRNSVIPYYLEGSTVLVHTGKLFKKLKISREKIWFKFGFFINTRSRISAEKLKKLKKKR